MSSVLGSTWVQGYTLQTCIIWDIHPFLHLCLLRQSVAPQYMPQIALLMLPENPLEQLLSWSSAEPKEATLGQDEIVGYLFQKIVGYLCLLSLKGHIDFE